MSAALQAATVADPGFPNGGARTRRRRRRGPRAAGARIEAPKAPRSNAVGGRIEAPKAPGGGGGAPAEIDFGAF